MQYLNVHSLPELPDVSHGVLVPGSRLVTCGMISVKKDEAGVAELVGPGDHGAQTTQILENLEKILKEGGCELNNVVSVLIHFVPFMQYGVTGETTANAFAPIKKAYRAFMTEKLERKKNMPARTSVQVAGIAFAGALVEISMEAAVPYRRRSVGGVA